ncbi:uncharacterized protein [Atheta coriaria]|uniref:uncharacterized protein n=1 Tax=Dalotia coriaria TaxID=877792 RepID=UPI0031F42288
MFIKLFYFLLYVIILTQCKIEIRDANVAALSRDEIGMVFYILMENSNACSYEVKVNMIECTEVITEMDKDSAFMYLIGGHMGVLKAHCFKNLTIIYPNMYLHNRRGYCLISIKFKTEQDEVVQKKANISFNTYISKKSTPLVMRGYFSKSELTGCETVDQDPLNHCNPVDCHMKYLGTRNYFSRHLQRCQKVPLCLTDPCKEMPDLIYSPGTNKCRDMEKTVTKADLQTIEAGMTSKADEDFYYSNANINCHFGKFNNLTGKCDCRDGWTSAPLEKDRVPQSGLFAYHMCNIESTDWYDTNSRKLKLICVIVGILAVIIAMIIIFVHF